MPGTVVSSFSVAVLMSIFPSPGISFACDLLVSDGLVVAMEDVGAGIAEIDVGEFAKGAACGRALFPGTKTLKDGGFCARTLSRSASTPQPPIRSEEHTSELQSRE